MVKTDKHAVISFFFKKGKEVGNLLFTSRAGPPYKMKKVDGL